VAAVGAAVAGAAVAGAAMTLPVPESTRMAPEPGSAPRSSSNDTTEPTAPLGRPCLWCGGVVDAAGRCDSCGEQAPSSRDHYTESPARWVAAVCDRGLRHHRNEDATAVAAGSEPGSRAVLVVCDGVSTSDSSDVASLAAARTARDVLAAARGTEGDRTARATALTAAVQQAAAAAHDAVVATSRPDVSNPASCTFAAAVIEDDLVVFGNVGDTRVYWIPDRGEPERPVELSLDDSMAQVRIAAGVPRDQAEHGPQAHAILKWLGRSSPDPAPRTGAVTVRSPGWLVACSDGLWNYISEAADLQELVARLVGDHPTPLHLAQALVAWANQQGGKDNISVALARRSG
jgi:serine/threonine protein phosphatase PrpC